MKPYRLMMKINILHKGVIFPCDLDLDNVLSTWIEYEAGYLVLPKKKEE